MYDITRYEYEGRFMHDIFNPNMTLFEMCSLCHLDINQSIITCQCRCHDNLTLLRQHNRS